MPDLITFPPGVLTEAPVRLDVLARGDAWFAVDKPAGLLLAPDAFHPDDAPSIVSAIHAAATAGKPQLASLGIAGCGRIHALDAEVGGAAVLATSENAAASLRNQLGSGHWEFVFDLVTEASDAAADEITCELPIGRHMSQPRMIVSHRGGKRCRTTFTRVRRLGTHEVWQARTAENRLHQVRLHAAESGLRIVGEFLYTRVRPVYLSSIKRRYRPGREEERPLHPGLGLHARIIRTRETAEPAIHVESPLPKTLAALIKRLEARG